MWRSREIFSRVDDVWELVSDLDNEWKYWSGYDGVRVVSRHERAVEVEVSFSGLQNIKGRELHLLDPKKSIATKLSGGPIVGERNLVLVPMGKSSTRVDVRWKFEPRGVPEFAFDLVSQEVAKRTEEALNRIEESAKGTAYFS